MKLLLLVAVSVHCISAIAAPPPSTPCPSYGCSFLPVDVTFDEAARKALRNVNREQAVVDAVLETAGNDNHVTLTLIGYKGGDPNNQINQDRAFIVNPFLQDYHLSGVFDGHGRLGEVVAEFAVTETPKRLAEKLLKIIYDKDIDNDAAVVKALQETFVEIDRDVPTKGVGGCTASVVLRMGSKLYVANAGDSRSLVALHDPIPNEETRRKSTVLYVSREDKPHLEDEKARIESMGGTVWIPPNLQRESSRVMHVDPKTGYQTGLAMSRSIGDWDMKGAIAEPLVEVIDLSQFPLGEEQCSDDEASADKVCSSKRKSLFVVSATDGMMDYISPEQLAESFARAFFEDTPHHPFNMAEDMIHQAAGGWDRDMNGEYRDDIAVAASSLSSVEAADLPPAQ